LTDFGCGKTTEMTINIVILLNQILYLVAEIYDVRHLDMLREEEKHRNPNKREGN
jgi:hypothetical protein